MSVNKIDQARNKISSLQILLDQIATDYAAEALILPTGDLAMSSDEMRKELMLFKMTKYQNYKKLLEHIKQDL